MPFACLCSDLGKLLFSKFTALLLITVLVMPLFLIKVAGNVKAERPRKVKQEPTVKNAPPEPFVIGGGKNTNPIRTNLTIGLASAIASFSLFGNSDQTKKDSQITTEPKEKSEPQGSSGKPEKDKAESNDTDLDEVENTNSDEVVTNLEPLPLPSPPAVPFDFDKDGKSDIGRWHAANYSFNIRKSDGTGNITATVGSSSAAKVAPGDFDGDGDYDMAVFLNGAWTINGMSPISFGTTGDIPVPGFYDANTTTDAAVFRPSDSTWYVNKSGGGTITQSWGQTGDLPATGDFDGDGLTDLSVFRPSNGYWWVMKSSGGTLSREWGLSGDVPVPADYDGDGATDIAVYRPSNGTWYVATSYSSFASTYSQTWGNYGDQPVPGYYDADDLADIAVWRPSNGTWYIAKSTSSGALQRYELGASGDLAVNSAFLKQSAFDVPHNKLGMAKLEPRNATGGTNLYSQNFSWGTSLVNLPGRSGMDMSFGVGYNSLVWTPVDTHENDTMVFDADAGGLTPGFRFGFPVIEPLFMNGETEKFTYTMISPSGARVEFRETSVDGTYESVDGSYTQLETIGSVDPNIASDAITIKVTTTDGTKMNYVFKGAVYKCTQIKDRNGNKIDIAYNDYGDLSTVTDTLGRVVTVNYGGNLLPSTITQTWKDTNGSGDYTTHTWATFTYTTKTIATDFADGVEVAGPDGWDVIVLEKITYADTSWTKFYYNGYAQVYKIENDADDDHKLNQVRTNLESPSADQTDCPRFTETRTWVENFNVGENEADEEVLVENSVPANSTYTVPGSSPQNTSVVEVTMPEHPDELYQIMHFGRSGWNEGLPIATRDCISSSCSSEKRWSWTGWTQDSTGVAYPSNPRVIETRVGDGTNTKRTTIDYYQPSTDVFPYSLPESVKVYDTDLSTVLKTQKTIYDLDSAYISRRIVGLPAQSELWQGTTGGTLMSKVTYTYDDDGYTGTAQSLSSATQHDTTNYGTSFPYRGNVTSVTQWDATAPTTSGSAISSSTKYNIAGSPISQTTPWDGTSTRTVSINYADAWNDGVSRTTYAYPTTITDPDENASTAKYRYDIGANVEALGPAPDGNSFGKKTMQLYDSLGRLEKSSIYRYASSIWTEHAYTRYSRPSPDTGIESKVYTTLVDVDGDGNIAEDEVPTDTWFDGAGRARIARMPHPGSSSGWSAVKTEYDILGRVKRQSVPTEIDPDDVNDPETWVPAGDDYRGGNWLWSQQEYDWKGRTTRMIPSDSDGTDGKDTLISYAGCGCAGGMITTVQGPLVPRNDDPETDARRIEKSHADILGRTFKTETFQWDGSTVYSTVVNTFNGRDQVTQSRQYAGNTSSSTYQDTTASFDGHGRLYQSHLPEQRDDSDNLKYTTYSYNPDGSMLSATDGRGVVTNFTYNNRGFLTNKVWNVGSTGITDITDVTYSYDDVGNRTEMTDGTGTTTYSYDSLSLLTAEAKEITGLSNTYTIDYEYTLTGALKSLTDPSGSKMNYVRDHVGRVIHVSNTAESSTLTIVDEMQYRAWGGVKKIKSSTSHEIDYTYNDRLQISTASVTDPLHRQTLSEGRFDHFSNQFEYHADGKVKQILDSTDLPQDPYYHYLYSHRDQKFLYDQAGRLSSDTLDMVEYPPLYEDPIHQFYYDAFENLTHASGTYCGVNPTCDPPAKVYENNRRQDNSYDADGRLTVDGSYSLPYPLTGRFSRKYDSAGTMASIGYKIDGGDDVQQTGYVYDGDGRSVKEFLFYPSFPGFGTNYSIYSSVTGEKVGTAWAAMADPETPERFWQSKISVGEGFTSQLTYEQPISNVHFEFSNIYPEDGNSDMWISRRDVLGNLEIAPDPPDPPSPPEQPSLTNIEPWEGDPVSPFDGRCTWDGGMATCDDVTQALNNGLADIDWRHTDQQILGHLGIVAWRPPDFETEGGRDTGEVIYGGEAYTGALRYTILGSSNRFGGDTIIDPRLPKDLITIIVNNAKKPDCKDILDKMFDALGKFGNVAPRDVDTLFSRIAEINVDPKLSKQDGVAYESRQGRVIDIRPPTSQNPEAQRNWYIKITTAELTHHFKEKGIYFDDQLDKAAISVLTSMTAAEAKRFSKTNLQSLKKAKKHKGDIGHALIGSYCQ